MPVPSNAAALTQAIACHQRGDLAAAETLYRQILAQDPNHPAALDGLGIIACEVGQFAQGIDLLRRAVSINPSVLDYQRHLGQASLETGDYPQACDTYLKLTQSPRANAIDWANLSIALRTLGRLKRALAAAQNAVALDPASPFAYAALGDVQDRLRDFHAAADAYEKSLQVKPDDAHVLDALATTYQKQGRVEKAIDTARRTVECALRLYPPLQAADFFQALLLLLHYDPRQTPSSILAEHQQWNQLLSSLRNPEPLNVDRSPDRRLRIGYVSPDFTHHPVGHAMLPLIQHHDHQAFEIVCYNDVLSPDAMTEKFRAAADHWRDIQNLSYSQLAQLIRNDRIDLLIDMAGQTPRNRLQAFAHRCAPVQISYGGYPATTGLSEMDYRITDPYLDPPGLSESHNSEKLLRLAASFWCYSPQDPGPDVNDLPASKSGFITFGSLNTAWKHTAPTLQTWAEILKRLPTSKLTILVNEADNKSPHLLNQFQNLGTDPARIQLVGRKPRAEYLAMYHQIDIALDPLTYNSHMTGCDTLWMGVPIITLTGPTSVSRAGTSLLTNLGLTELIAPTPESYIRIATQLAGDLARLSILRSSLRQRMTQSPLCDAQPYVREIERLYRTAWKSWCAAAI